MIPSAMAGFFIGSAVSPAPHQVPAGSTPERNRSVHQKGCDLVNVEGNTAQGKSHNTTSFKSMNNINLNSRDQLLALAMDPSQSAFTFSEEDFDDDLTLNELAGIHGGLAPFYFVAAAMFALPLLRKIKF